MFQYTNIKAELEEFKCPVHKKSATVTFENGKMEVSSYCCSAHLNLLQENLNDLSVQSSINDMLAEVF